MPKKKTSVSKAAKTVKAKERMEGRSGKIIYTTNPPKGKTKPKDVKKLKTKKA